MRRRSFLLAAAAVALLLSALQAQVPVEQRIARIEARLVPGIVVKGSAHRGEPLPGWLMLAGWTSRSKSNPRGGPHHGSIGCGGPEGDRQTVNAGVSCGDS